MKSGSEVHISGTADAEVATGTLPSFVTTGYVLMDVDEFAVVVGGVVQDFDRP